MIMILQFLYYGYEYFACIYFGALFWWLLPRVQKRALHQLAVRSQMVVSLHLGPGN